MHVKFCAPIPADLADLSTECKEMQSLRPTGLTAFGQSVNRGDDYSGQSAVVSIGVNLRAYCRVYIAQPRSGP